MKDFIKRHKSPLVIITVFIALFIVSLFLTCLIWSLFTVEYKGPELLKHTESLEESESLKDPEPLKKFSYFNVSNSTEYQEATEIVKLELLSLSRQCNVNNKTISIETIHVIENDKIQKILSKTYTVETCDENILIGDKECYNRTIQINTVFIHEEVSTKLKKHYDFLDVYEIHGSANFFT